jgi:N-acyl-D-amino-acid deacylase
VPICDTLIRNVRIIDGSGADPSPGSVAVDGDRITELGDLPDYTSQNTIDGHGRSLAPGFIDAHTHDDLYLIRKPEMLPKLSQGVTTVIVGNCGISAAPAKKSSLVDPMNLLGRAEEFSYSCFGEYVAAVERAAPAVNVAAFVGHTVLRNNVMDCLNREATSNEVASMRAQLCDALDQGATGLSTGLAYASAYAASTAEVQALAECLSDTGAIYATHLRSEGDRILAAIDEAFEIGRHANTPIVISHLKCAGVDHWHKSGGILRFIEDKDDRQSAAWDCYPYTASSSTLDLRQVDERVDITITWSDRHPEIAGKSLADVAAAWGTTQLEAARQLQPAGAIYHCMSEEDVRAILRHPGTMIGSDGLPNDPLPHPRLWGSFTRVLGPYTREHRLFKLGEAVRKMTSLPARRFRLSGRGRIKKGYAADLVLFDAERISDQATYANPLQASVGIDAVWVNGVLAYLNGAATGNRGGRFLPRQPADEKHINVLGAG